MQVHVLLYDSGKDNEGIHSLEIKDKTVVIMFEDKDDAERYCGLLEAQDFPCPSVERVSRDEIETFCSQSGYEARLVEKGFIPKSQEDRLLISPPQSNLDVSDWNNFEADDIETLQQSKSDDLENIRKDLENLL
tara:strand:+ start:17049 stop:17450 length:402 start_codon:yes stop_codon:yes gene_type:complete